MNEDELKRAVKFHGPKIVGAAAKAHPTQVCRWVRGACRPVEIRLKWIEDALGTPPTWEELAPLTGPEIKAIIRQAGGPATAAKLLGVHIFMLCTWQSGKFQPLPRYVVALRRLAQTPQDTRPLGIEELLQIVNAVGREKLCSAIGCAPQILQFWLQGRRSPGPKYRVRLRAAYRTKCI